MLASELRLHGVHTVVVEKRAEPAESSADSGCTCAASKSWTSAALEHGSSPAAQTPGGRLLRWDHEAVAKSLDTAHPYILGIPQPTTDRLLGTRR